ncbi:MAG: response regulator [Phycisphaeraceae bacterium]|nr:response regulator [Phycisphaeraceae bacterium]
MSTTPIRVLLVEDEPAHAAMVRRYLGAVPDLVSGVQWVERLSAAIDVLSRETFDVILLDLGLPDSAPVDTLERILARTDEPVVVLTTSEDREQALKAVKAGAQDYLPKALLSTDMLLRTLSHAIERNRSELQLKQLNETLERRVAERTAVAERRAVMLRRLAVELTRTEGRERRRLAHLLHDDLQQLLVAARMTLDTLTAEQHDQSIQEYVGRAIDLINQSIRVSRSLTQDLSPPVLHEQGLGAGLNWLARRMQEQHGLEIAVAVIGPPQRFSEDMATLLLEIARELLFNVVKHAGVHDAAARLDCTDPHVCRLSIEDSGAGFNPMDQHSAGDAGFGLFSVRERLEAVGGTFELHSSPGAGCTVRLVAPYGRNETSAATEFDSGLSPTNPSQPAPDHQVATPMDSRLRILVADDHPIVRQGLIAVINDVADLHIVAEAHDGASAIQAIEQTPVDVVLMDVSMTGMDGMEATRQIKARWPAVRVIGLSMHDQAEVRDAMISAGATTYLSKAGLIDSLIGTIRSATQLSLPSPKDKTLAGR